MSEKTHQHYMSESSKEPGFHDTQDSNFAFTLGI